MQVVDLLVSFQSDGIQNVIFYKVPQAFVDIQQMDLKFH